MAFVHVLILTCLAIDGDTLKCGGDRYRLIGIDAPEMTSCRRGRACVEGDAKASKAHLAKLVQGQKLRIELHGEDRYRRRLAFASVHGVDLSCAMIRAGRAIYVAKWDKGKRLAQRCKGFIGLLSATS